MATATLKKSRTVNINKHEVDFRVLQFTSRDSSVLSSLGKHCKESYWKIGLGSDQRPVEIRVTVDKQVAMSPEVSVTCDNQQVFPGPGSQRGKLKEDFTHKWPFRGTLPGIGLKDTFEVRPDHVVAEQWFPAVLTDQTEEGLFKAIAVMPNRYGGFDEVHMINVKSSNIREVRSKKSPVVPNRSLVLHVPKNDPLHCTLAVDGQELITHFFAVPSPPVPQSTAPQQQKPVNRVFFQVSRDRQTVVADCGHARLAHFLNGEVRIVSQESTQSRRSWTFLVAPGVQHTVELERKGDMARLLVDGELLVDSNAEDIDSREGLWECSFRLMGEKFMDWEVWESDHHGNTLSTQGIVTHRAPYTHDVVVNFPEGVKSLDSARLFIDERDFTEHAEARPPRPEQPIQLSPDALRHTYNLMVPYRFKEDVGFFDVLPDFTDSFLNFFACCTNTTSALDESGKPLQQPAEATQILKVDQPVSNKTESIAQN